MAAGRAWTLIAVGLLCNTVGDAIFLYQTAVGTYAEGTYLDLAWPLSLALIALAAWQRPERVSRVEDALKRHQRAKERFLAAAVAARPRTGRDLRQRLGRDEHSAIAAEMARFL